jgi:hypothetical protein
MLYYSLGVMRIIFGTVKVNSILSAVNFVVVDNRGSYSAATGLVTGVGAMAAVDQWGGPLNLWLETWQFIDCARHARNS